jgi:hypothetical protein
MKPFTAEYVRAVAEVVPLPVDSDRAESLLEILEGARPLLEAVDDLPCGPGDDPFAFPSVLREPR